jgi:ATP-dependent DNA helicase DinG
MPPLLPGALRLSRYVRCSMCWSCSPSPGREFRAFRARWALRERLGIEVEAGAAARALPDCALQLLAELPTLPEKTLSALRPMTQTLAKAGWRWAPLILDIIEPSELQRAPLAGFEVWRTLPEWEDAPLPPKPTSHPVSQEEARARLAQLVGNAGEERPEQRAYSDAASYAFSPRERAGSPRVALVEAGTGIGKTLGYLAPASLWAEKNGPGLWISTYTRNLQRQIVAEIARLYPDPDEREDKAVVRKGRENYLCLLNFEDAVKRQALAPGPRTVALALIARWISARRATATFPAAAFRRSWRRICRFAKSPTGAASASMPLARIIASVSSSGWCGAPAWRRSWWPIMPWSSPMRRRIGWARTKPPSPGERRVRYVFDEGHHLFDAADSGFAAAVSGTEMADMRRWVRGPEGRARSRSRGLEERLKDLVEGQEDAGRALENAVAAAGALGGRRLAEPPASPARAGREFPQRRLSTRPRPKRRSRSVLFGRIRNQSARRRNHRGGARSRHRFEAAGGAVDAAGQSAAPAVGRQSGRAGTGAARPDRCGGARPRMARADRAARLDEHAGRARNRRSE